MKKEEEDPFDGPEWLNRGMTASKLFAALEEGKIVYHPIGPDYTITKDSFDGSTVLVLHEDDIQHLSVQANAVFNMFADPQRYFIRDRDTDRLGNNLKQNKQ